LVCYKDAQEMIDNFAVAKEQEITDGRPAAWRAALCIRERRLIGWVMGPQR